MFCSRGAHEYPAGTTGRDRRWCSTDCPRWHLGPGQEYLHPEPTATLCQTGLCVCQHSLNPVCHWGSALVHPCSGSTGHWEKEWVRHQNTAYKRLRVNVGVCGPCTGLAGEEPRHCGGKPRSPHLPSLQETWLHWRRTRDCEDNLLTLTCIACQNHCIVCQNHITANLCHVRNDDEERR